MTGFLGTLGQKLAERWMTLLVLPGALYVSAAVAASVLGHANALNLARLTRQITIWAHSPAAGSVGGQATLLVAALAAAGLSGLVAQTLGGVAERFILAAEWSAWPQPLRKLASWRVSKRRDRWLVAWSEYLRLREEARSAHVPGIRSDPTQRDLAYRKAVRVAENRPERPTWSGERLNTTVIRLRDECGLDLIRTWSALWLVFPDAVRAEIATARASLAQAAVLSGWAALYAVLIVWWWPAALISIALAVISRHRIRAAADIYAQLIDAAARLHSRTLAEQFGLPSQDGAVEAGRAVTRHLSPGPPQPPD